MSPSASPEITVLRSPLACVGFGKQAARQCSEKIRQLIVWPELVRESIADLPRYLASESDVSQSIDVDVQRGMPSMASSITLPAARPFISYTRTQDGSSLVTEIHFLRGLFRGDDGDVPAEIQCGSELGLDDEPDSDSESDSDSGNNSDSDAEGRDPPKIHDATANREDYSKQDRRKKALSLPSLSGKHFGGGNTAIPISWSGHSFRSMSFKQRFVQKPKIARKVGGGRKRCLQLDLTSVSDDVESSDQGVYHLGECAFLSAVP